MKMNQNVVNRLVQLLHDVRDYRLHVTNHEFMKLLKFLGQRDETWKYDYLFPMTEQEVFVISYVPTKTTFVCKRQDKHLWILANIKTNGFDIHIPQKITEKKTKNHLKLVASNGNLTIH